jgi:hypothetical protein
MLVNLRASRYLSSGSYDHRIARLRNFIASASNYWGSARRGHGSDRRRGSRASVTITDPNTKTSQTATSGNGGEYQFNNLLAGTYSMTVQPPSGSNFSTLTISDVRRET